MASLSDIRETRLEKQRILKAAGMEPYASLAERGFSLAALKQDFENLSDQNVSIAGRIMAIRGQGAILFVVLKDGTGQFQAVMKRDEIEESLFKLFVDAVDVGDFIQISGTTFVTQKGEKSVLAKSWKMLSKALLPLPEKWAGLQDVEERYRKRYLDLISDEEVFERFQKRSAIVRAIRDFFEAKGFIEVETPVLQNQAGGAMAKAFLTHHDDYDMDMALRISLEIEHKMLMAGGFERIFEIGKCFRNEGSDPTHIQEFTMLEWYAAYASLEDNMAWTEELVRSLAKNVMGKSVFTVYDKDGSPVEVDFAGAWTRVKFSDLLKENAGLDMSTADDDQIRNKAKDFGMDEEELKKTGRANLLDFIFKKSSRNIIVHPTFVLDYPGELKPLAVQNSDGTAKVCQLIVAGAEITNQYAELIDPQIQRKLLEDQARAKKGGDLEAMSVNEEFLTAMEHGMPPMTGFGIGIDRLVALLTEQNNLRDTIFFPIMRPRGKE